MYSECAKMISDRILKINNGFEHEEDVRFNCEHIFTDELLKVGIPYQAKYEVQISTGFVDALFNTLCVEYKSMGLLRKGFHDFAVEKSKYFRGLAEKYKTGPDQIIGVLIDGQQIGFFRQTEDGFLVERGPFDISPESIELLVKYAATTTKKALIAENVLQKFDSNSALTHEIVQAFWYALGDVRDTRTKMFFTEWKRVFGQVADFGEQSRTIIDEAARYGLSITGDGSARFIFVLHTMYAVIIKHIALMILQARKTGQYQLPNSAAHGTPMQVISELLEDGSEFVRLGIRNFLEGDYFSWYVLEWNDDIDSIITKIIRELSQYEPSTGTLKPEAVKDLLKELYQGLLSGEMRHNLGEYYTPDWLAEYTMHRGGYTVNKKALDPACGSGTFLVLAISRIIQERADMPPCELLTHILSHVYGFDLNPLAVISSRTNYLVAIEPLLEYADDIELPVYLSDAIFSPKKENGTYTYFLDTENGHMQLRLPESLFDGRHLSGALDKIEELANLTIRKKTVSKKQAREVLSAWAKGEGLNVDDTAMLLILYEQIEVLEENDWDGIWCRIIKNYFTSATLSDFDIIIGNPPWLKWSALPGSYRETIKQFCRSYGLFSSDKFYGGVESDISTMVLYSAAEKWLRDGGTLAMLITRSVFKTESSEGFRMFTLPGEEMVKFRVAEVEDFTAIQPFEGAQNKPTLIVLTKGATETEYPLPWVSWSKVGRAAVKTDDALDDVLAKTERTMLVAHPVGSKGSPWLTIHADKLAACLSLARTTGRPKIYSARKGICTDLNGLYFGTIQSVGPKTSIFTNSVSKGRRTAGMEQHSVRIENNLLFPLAKGREVTPFHWDDGDGYVILPQTSMHGFTVEKMAEEYPMALRYFSSYRALLSQRSSLRRYLKNDPFYTCWNVGAYTFAKYKVCWGEISSRLKSCVLSEKNGRTVIPDHKIYFIPTDNEIEAHYLCGILNASAVEEFVFGYVENTQIGTHIVDYLHIPKYDETKLQHTEIARISLAAHRGEITAELASASIDGVIAEGI